MTPAELAELAGWLTLPWTVKMVFGELVDSVPIFGSQRRAYVFIGAAFIALGMLLLAGAAGGWLTFASLENLYRLGAFSSVLGVVIQDVVGRRHEHRGGRAREPGRLASRQGRGRPRARHGAGAGAAGAVVRHLPRSRRRRMDRRHLQLCDRVSRRAHHSGHLGERRGVDHPEAGREQPHRLAHPRRRHCLRRLRAGARRSPTSPTTRRSCSSSPWWSYAPCWSASCTISTRRPSARSSMQRSSSSSIARRRSSGRATPGSRSTCWASTRPSRARWGRSGPGSRCSACGCSPTPSPGARCQSCCCGSRS